MVLAPDASRRPLTELMAAVAQALRTEDGIPVERSSWAISLLMVGWLNRRSSAAAVTDPANINVLKASICRKFMDWAGEV